MKKLLLVIIILSAVGLFLGPVLAEPLSIESPDGGVVTIDTFNPTGGWGNASFLTIGARILTFAFGGLLVAWIFIIIFAAIKIIRQPGEGLEGGTKRIQNVFYGITIGLLFFVAISFIGTLAGVGNIFEWSDSFQECSCEAAGDGECYQFKFQAEASREDGDSINWFCYGVGDNFVFPEFEGKGWLTTAPPSE